METPNISQLNTQERRDLFNFFVLQLLIIAMQLKGYR